MGINGWSSARRACVAQRLRERSLGTKRSMALREFALGIESLERFTRGEPLYRVHECAFGVLALESESVDPRL
jgi:PNKP adenylyltransferase domain, ligase domain